VSALGKRWGVKASRGFESHLLRLKMNKVIKFLLLGDTVIFTGLGLSAPILAIFIADYIVEGSILMAGIASALYFVIKAFIQIPFSRYIDAHDDIKALRWLLIGTFLIIVTPFIYMIANHIYWIFLAQIIYGIGVGFYSPSWMGIWAGHLDEGHESFEWSTQAGVAGLGAAMTALAGAAIAQYLGFRFTFLLAGIICFIGGSVLVALSHQKVRRGEIVTESWLYYFRKKILRSRN
jgi:MFS family permease